MRIRRCGRNHDVSFSPSPQDCGRNKHQDARNTECDRGAEMSQKERHQQRREERAEVNDPVESLEHYLGAVLVSLINMIANKGGDTRFDPARAKRDQAETDIETDAIRDKHREACLAYAINQA